MRRLWHLSLDQLTVGRHTKHYSKYLRYHATCLHEDKSPLFFVQYSFIVPWTALMIKRLCLLYCRYWVLGTRVVVQVSVLHDFSSSLKWLCTKPFVQSVLRWAALVSLPASLNKDQRNLAERPRSGFLFEACLLSLCDHGFSSVILPSISSSKPRRKSHLFVFTCWRVPSGCYVKDGALPPADVWTIIREIVGFVHVLGLIVV